MSRLGGGALRVFAVILAAASAEVARADESPQGRTADGLPGAVRLAAPSGLDPGVWLGAFAGYGLTESVTGSGDSHHRLLMGVAGSWIAAEWLALSLRFEGRYDLHSDLSGSDESLTGEPRLSVLVAQRLGGRWWGAARLGLWWPNRTDHFLDPAALTPEGELLVEWSGSRLPLALMVGLGFRFDRSAAAAPNADRLSPGDRVALGLSAFNSVPIGVGAVWRLRSFELLSEWSWTVLLGADAPPAGRSPMRLSAGARWPAITRALQLGVLATLELSARSPFVVTDPLVPVEPRFLLTAVIALRLDAAGQPDAPTTLHPPALITAPPPETTRPASIRGRVLSLQGNAVSDAEVSARTKTASASTRTDADGGFALPGLEPGTVQIAVRAPGYFEVQRSVELERGAEIIMDLSLGESLRPGELRGAVRSAQGRGLRASILIEPIGLELTSNADGSFSVSVPPGSYEVIVRARAHAEQRRQVSVDEQGVTVLNVDLRRQ
ncbi:MAG: carboxypeptidase regulatory-like domain-containing protein [Deltaproteobacteria bacterium]|nr:carboxypeptidase regulatory-like domain-containing protein [Deltaproteobacteria bacterium]